MRSYLKECKEADSASSVETSDEATEEGSSCSLKDAGLKESGPTRTSGVPNTLGTGVVESGEFDFLGIELDPDIMQSIFGTLSPSAGLVDFDGGIF